DVCSSDLESMALFQQAEGKAVKIFPQIFPCLSPAFEYQIIYIYRDLKSVEASQRKMLHDIGRDPNEVRGEAMEKFKFRDLVYTRAFESLVIQHSELIANPPRIARHIFGWMGG